VGELIAVIATGKEDVAALKKKYASGQASGQPPEKASRPAPEKREPVPAAAGAAAGAGAASAASAAGATGASTFEDASAGEMREGDHVHHHGATRQDIDTTPRRGNGRADGRLKASPLARRIAQDKGIDLAQITGSGPGGRIVQKDVLAASPGSRPAPAGAGAASTGAGLPKRVPSGKSEVIPLSKIRTVVAQRLQLSKQQVPHFYETIDVDVESLTALRQTLNKQLEAQNIRTSISDFINKAIASALLRHPNLNAHFSAQKNEITRFGDVNLGIAVALPDGLIVPVLRGIDQMGIPEIRQRSVELAEKARAGRLKQDELSRATFTVSTLGMYGIRDFSAIINPPEVAILAVGAAAPRAVVREGRVVARTMMSLTLSVDHRAVDGASAAEFLGTLRDMLEQPAMMFM
jgi:pyruvate dehydrogenase E2 component (dihydrolipoamide acetyltransferase)